MNHVWLLFKMLQLLLGIGCMSIHIHGSLEITEPLPHHLLFCGTLSGFILLSGIGCIRLIVGQRTVLHPDLLFAVCGMAMHFLCAWISLLYAEGDFHLIYMGPEEELDHVYFFHCKTQSLMCIITGAVYLLQGVLLLDLIVKSPLYEDLKPMIRVTEPPVWDSSLKTMTNVERDTLARTSADVYFLGNRVDHWLRIKFQWFRQLAGAQPLMSTAQAEAELARRYTDSVSNNAELLDLPSNASSIMTFQSDIVEKNRDAFEALRSILSDQFQKGPEDDEDADADQDDSDNYSLR